jgi:hypothetical protein
MDARGRVGTGSHRIQKQESSIRYTHRAGNVAQWWSACQVQTSPWVLDSIPSTAIKQTNKQKIHRYMHTYTVKNVK